MVREAFTFSGSDLKDSIAAEAQGDVTVIPAHSRNFSLNDLRHRDVAFVLENGLHISENRLEIFSRKLAIVVEDMFLGPASGFEPEQELHGDPRTLDSWSTTASVRVSDDPLAPVHE